jgi:protein arginine kinase activator
MNYRCERCKKVRATVHITDSFPEVQERHLCEDCAAEEGLIIKSPKVVAPAKVPETTQEILQEFLSKHKPGTTSVGGKERSCPDCEMTFRSFQVKGQLGCPTCYSAFRDMLLPLIDRAHEGGTKHIGKVPARAEDAVRRRTNLLRLRRALQEAIDREDYEEAARMRDEISALESV